MKSIRPRKATSLPDPLQQRLSMYAIAAGAAGASLFGLAPTAGARIVYTPAHIVIGRNSKIVLDLAHNRVSDFMLQETLYTTSSVGENHSLVLSVVPGRKANEVWGMKHRASALAAGVRIGPKGRFSSGKMAMALDFYADGTGGSGTCAGAWNDVKSRYLGLKFVIHGETHFGWARLNVTCVTKFVDHKINGLLTGYAYETVPGKPIVAGKTKDPDQNGAAQKSASQPTLTSPPATLGKLALGSLAGQ